MISLLDSFQVQSTQKNILPSSGRGKCFWIANLWIFWILCIWMYLNVFGVVISLFVVVEINVPQNRTWIRWFSTSLGHYTSIPGETIYIVWIFHQIVNNSASIFVFRLSVQCFCGESNLKIATNWRGQWVKKTTTTIDS